MLIQNPAKHLRWTETIFAKRSILDIWEGSEYVTECKSTGWFLNDGRRHMKIIKP